MPLMVLEKANTDLGVINTNFLSAVDTQKEVNYIFLAKDTTIVKLDDAN